VPVPFRNAFVADAVPGRLLLIVRDSCDTWDQKFQGSIGEFTLPSGPVRRVGSLAGEDAAYSPDGRRIAFSRFDELWVANRDASDAHRIAQAPGAVLAIHWSPDGQLLRFSVHLDNEFGYMLEEADTRTGQVRSLIPKRDDGADGLYGTWMSDGQFVFGARRGLSVNLWGIAPEKWPSSGRTVRQLTYGPLDFSRPAAIPGRNQLAVVGVQRQGELQRFDSHLQRFVPILNGISAGMADFSRDGKWAVYVTYPERELWRSRADGSDATRLTRGSLRAGLPRISPDGRQVAFTGDYSGRELRTWIVPFDGGEPRPATTPAEGTAEVAPTWSQDGARLLVRLDLAVGRNVLAIIDVASGKIERIPGSEQKFNQRWSPDGRWITATPNNMEGLDVFNVASREWRSLSKMRADYPNWSRNSESVLFCSSLDSGEEAIYRVYLASGEAERVTTLVGTPRVNDELYSRWVGLTADDSPMVLRSADLQRIYRLSFSGS
jgi:Tol biopolymer transport system component